MHKTREYLLVAVGVMMLAAVAVEAWGQEAPATPAVIPPNTNNLPKVMLIGDSITSAYWGTVAKALEGKAVVTLIQAKSTVLAVKDIDGTLGDTKWDVIHFNWGVWDMYGWTNDPTDRSPAMYAQRLETLVVRMKKTGARLIWATTTPAPPKPEITMLKQWKKEVVIDQDLERQYQEAALQVMKKHDVQVNDLYALLKPRQSEFQADDNVHMSGAASALMAGQAAECILKCLNSAMEKRNGESKLPRVLLLGDSISGGYAGQVNLNGKALAVRCGNGGPSTVGVKYLDEVLQQLGDEPWDLIHFNWGLHDMTFQTRFAPEERGIDQYAARLEQLVVRLKKTGAKLIWATTTPWCPEPYDYAAKSLGVKLQYSAEEEKQWKDAALNVMKKHDIPVNDLHALLLPNLNDYLNKPDDIHFNRKGDEAMGRKIAVVIGESLQLDLAQGAGQKQPQQKPVDMKKPVKIYLLSGQSNMTGRGNLGDLNKPAAEQQATLVRYIMDPQNVEKYKSLYEEDERKNLKWAVRDDVFITMGDWPHDGSKERGKHGGLGPYYGGRGNSGFGPEMPIGHALGDFHAEPVLLVKVSFGGNSLAVNFRPPSSGGTLGDKYPLVIKAVADAIEHLAEIVPGYQKETGYEIAGFFWNQGEHDGSPEFSTEYEKNLANLIKDLRKEFKAPGMKAVIAVTGFGGRDPKDPKTGAAPKGYENQLKVIAAQLAVPLRSEFNGTVATVETRDFWRSQEPFGGNNQGIHWNGNGESYWLMGEAMGLAMVELLKNPK